MLSEKTRKYIQLTYVLAVEHTLPTLEKHRIIDRSERLKIIQMLGRYYFNAVKRDDSRSIQLLYTIVNSGRDLDGRRELSKEVVDSIRRVVDYILHDREKIIERNQLRSRLNRHLLEDLENRSRPLTSIYFKYSDEELEKKFSLLFEMNRSVNQIMKKYIVEKNNSPEKTISSPDR